MVDRSDKVTTARVQQDPFFSDFTTNFNKHPNSGNLTRVINESAVKQAIVNLLLTDRGERLFQPNAGGSVRALLFEMVDGFSAHMLQDEIIRTIRNNEPRVDQLEVLATPKAMQDGYDVTIAFTIFNHNETISFDLVLMRIR
jgi:phage baseplate assembly protein W